MVRTLLIVLGTFSLVIHYVYSWLCAALSCLVGDIAALCFLNMHTLDTGIVANPNFPWLDRRAIFSTFVTFALVIVVFNGYDRESFDRYDFYSFEKQVEVSHATIWVQTI
ncbi:MAG: hypothetical protein P4M11_02340 [Candidatus Pacebacteria bacterium]|nr:hypothetical protein [Candidatus Paceibacterota bacterium]